MATAIRGTHPKAKVELIPGGGGDFIVRHNGEQLWHKRQMDDAFPENDAILAKL